MLVLTRKIGEKIIIGGGIELKVLSCKTGRVKIGITAPVDVRVLRSELVEHDGSPKPEPVADAA